MGVSNIVGSQPQPVNPHGILKSAMNANGSEVKKLLESMPNAKETREMELSVNSKVGSKFDQSV